MTAPVDDGDGEAPSIETRTATSAPAPAQPAPALGAPPLSQQHDPDRYEIIGEHGRGGLGRVTRVHDRNLGRDVAIKELIAHTPLAELRFQREALITARLEHPGIVPIHEAGRWPDGTPFYAMKLVAGRPLRALIAERGTVEDRLGLLHHVIAVADAIAYAHGRGIIHRDLKPANVIVGDFGETVVIDWGLAKDLGASDDLPAGAPSPDSPDSPDLGDIGLTSAGSVLGTPAYMAPEQARGEPVDQRADVFAIGAMLWELCSLAKVPPTDRRLRDRLLRRAHIDRDLIAIIDKALAPAPALRYPDAGALAADLKAFKAGARIASRDYSLLATLAHWARRHRALALAIAAALVTLIAGSVLYVHGVTVERDRADAFNNDLILSNAESLMPNDPTAAAALLHRYTGPDRERLTMLDQEARSRGVAILQIHPHSEQSNFAFSLEDGSILAYGDHDKLVKISMTGAVRPIASMAPEYSTVRYAKARHTLAFTCSPSIVCLLDTVTEQTHTRILAFDSKEPLATKSRTKDLVFSPDENGLAIISDAGLLTVWDVSDLHTPRHILNISFDPIRWTIFANSTTLFVVTNASAFLVHIHPKNASADITTLPVEAGDLLWSFSSRETPSDQYFAVGTRAGQLLLLDTQTGEVADQTQACASATFSVLQLPSSPEVVFTCSDGEVGIWNTKDSTTRELVHLENAAYRLSTTSEGRWIYMGGFSGEIIAYDLATKRQLKYEGHPGRIFVLRAPSPAFPYLLSADHLGYIRVWQPIPNDDEIVYQSQLALARVWFTAWNHGLISIDVAGNASWHHDDVTEALSTHATPHRFLQLDRLHARALFYGGDRDLELWSFAARPNLKSIHMSETSVLSAAFSPDENSVLVGFENGEIASWRLTDGLRSTLSTLDDSALWLYPCSAIRQTVARTRYETRMIAGEHVRFLRKETRFNHVGTCSGSGVWLAVGSSGGEVELVSTVGGWSLPIYKAPATIKSLAFSPDSEELAIVSEDELATRAASSTDHTASSASHITLDRPVRIVHANQATYSPDGRWLAVTCDNGDVWFYQRVEARWVYRSVGTTRITSSSFSDDSAYFATGDASGRLVSFNLLASSFR